MDLIVTTGRSGSWAVLSMGNVGTHLDSLLIVDSLLALLASILLSLELRESVRLEMIVYPWALRHSAEQSLISGSLDLVLP